MATRKDNDDEIFITTPSTDEKKPEESQEKEATKHLKEPTKTRPFPHFFK